MGRRGDERAAILRAAAAYADLGRLDIGRIIGQSKESVSRIFAGTKTLTDEEARVFVEACGLPPRFAEVGFAPLREPITELEADFYEWRDQAETRLARLEAAAAPAPQGRIRQRIAGEKTNPESRPRSGRRRAGGSNGDTGRS